MTLDQFSKISNILVMPYSCFLCPALMICDSLTIYNVICLHILGATCPEEGHRPYLRDEDIAESWYAWERAGMAMFTHMITGAPRPLPCTTPSVPLCTSVSFEPPFQTHWRSEHHFCGYTHTMSLIFDVREKTRTSSTFPVPCASQTSQCSFLRIHWSHIMESSVSTPDPTCLPPCFMYEPLDAFGMVCCASVQPHLSYERLRSWC